MKIEKLENNNFTPSANTFATIKYMGNITEIRSMAREPKATIKKIDNHSYIELSTRRNKRIC